MKIINFYLKNLNKNRIAFLNRSLFFVIILIIFSVNNFTSSSQARQIQESISRLKLSKNIPSFTSNENNNTLDNNFNNNSSQISFDRSSQKEQAVVKGEKGLYEGQIIVNGSMEKIWNLLTDYDNLENYFPDVKSSKLLTTNNNNKVFEQVRTVNFPFVNIETTITISTTETYPKEIQFNLVKGNLKTLKGSWKISKIRNNKMLVSHNVEVKPNLKSTEEFLFYRIYKESIKNTLEAIKKEIEKGS